MENEEGDLLVLDHPYCNEYYEYALKQRILENMLFAWENVSNQLEVGAVPFSKLTIADGDIPYAKLAISNCDIPILAC